MSDIDIIKDLLINESGIDVNEKTRKREVIEMQPMNQTVTLVLTVI